MSGDAILNYVTSSASLLGLPLDEARARRVAVHLERTAVLAQSLDAAPLAPDDELAEIYRPAPFVILPEGRCLP